MGARVQVPYLRFGTTGSPKRAEKLQSFLGRKGLQFEDRGESGHVLTIKDDSRCLGG